ncbi:MAG: hypothetical protein HW387_1193 [Parachlamydiales bacterium]|nr:hypothetical protein [Parachlamydiales bacterium]
MSAATVKWLSGCDYQYKVGREKGIIQTPRGLSPEKAEKFARCVAQILQSPEGYAKIQKLGYLDIEFRSGSLAGRWEITPSDYKGCWGRFLEMCPWIASVF